MRKIPKKLILSSFVLVVLSAASFMNLKTKDAAKDKNILVIQPKTRKIASIPNSENKFNTSNLPSESNQRKEQNSVTQLTSQQLRAQLKFETGLTFTCDELLKFEQNAQAAFVNSGHVIIKLNSCASLEKNQTLVKLKNKTNGYDAQIFKTANSALNSDFIQLDKGINELEFELSLNDGQKTVQRLKINRLE